MRRLPVFTVLLVFLPVTLPVFAQEGPPDQQPPPAGIPAPPSPGIMAKRGFIIGGPATSGKTVVAGKKITARVVVPEDIQAANVTVTVAGKTFTSSTKPYRIEIDTAGIPDGDQVVNAVAADANGAEVWKGSAAITIDNAGKIAQSPAGPRPGTVGPRATAGAPGAPMSPAQPKPGNGKRTRSVTDAPAGISPMPPAVPISGDQPGQPESQPPVTVTQTFKNVKYGVSLKFPAGWRAADLSTQVKPKEPGGFWFTFTSPEAPPQLTINFRHTQLSKPTTPENWVKYNTYLQEWAKVQVNGKVAFETTEGAEEARRVVHRKMIIDGKHIWRFNCIDQTGSPSFESKMVMDQVINSFMK